MLRQCLIVDRHLNQLMQIVSKTGFESMRNHFACANAFDVFILFFVGFVCLFSLFLLCVVLWGFFFFFFLCLTMPEKILKIAVFLSFYMSVSPHQYKVDCTVDVTYGAQGF